MSSHGPLQAQLRLTAQRLGQIQDKLDSQGQITRGDIATLLQQGNISLARAKAQKSIHDDIYGDLLQTLEMQVGVILEHVGELERRYAGRYSFAVDLTVDCLMQYAAKSRCH